MIYNVDTARIERQFTCLKESVEILHHLKNKPLSSLDLFALARALHLSIESIADVGSVLIDGFLMRDPGGYIDIIEILEDESVLSKSDGVEIKQLIQLREKLVRDYDTLTESQMLPYINKTHLLLSFITSVEEYLRAHQSIIAGGSVPNERVV